ncbi:hypothetical protein OSTOST_19755 [Ostertagia ostertagi]
MWIGCWWLGFVIFGVVLFFPSLALFLFPSDRLDESNVKVYPKDATIDGTAPLKPRKTLNLYDKHVKIHGKHVTAGEKMSEFLVAARSLFRNPIYVGAMFGRIIDVLAFKGANNFSFPLVGKIAFVMACPSIRGDVFYSPCQAGCPLSGANFSIYSKAEKGVPLTFTECECAGTDDLAVSRNYCPTEHCDRQFHVFLIVKIIGALFGGLSVVPGMLIVLPGGTTRTSQYLPRFSRVPREFTSGMLSNGVRKDSVDKNKAPDLHFRPLLRTFVTYSTLPSPVFWGKIFDMSCLMWQNVCTKTGACPIYDTDQLRIRLHVIYGSLRLFALFSDIWVVYWAKGLKLVDEEDESSKTSDGGDTQELGPLTKGGAKAVLPKAVVDKDYSNKE